MFLSQDNLDACYREENDQLSGSLNYLLSWDNRNSGWKSLYLGRPEKNGRNYMTNVKLYQLMLKKSSESPQMHFLIIFASCRCKAQFLRSKVLKCKFVCSYTQKLRGKMPIFQNYFSLRSEFVALCVTPCGKVPKVRNQKFTKSNTYL